jgi:hypothetical protein
MTALDERAALAHMVIGPERAEKITAQEADGIALKHGMPLDRARKYATSCFDTADTETIIRVGQVWARDHDGQRLPGDDLVKLLGREPDKTYTVHGFDGCMVDVGGGHLVNVMQFRSLWLVAWPESFTLDEEPPQAPATPIADGKEEAPSEEGRFDPHKLWTLSNRRASPDGKMPPYLPLLGDHYTAVNIHKPQYEPAYSNVLDVPAYLAEHLADYRAGWDDWRTQSSGGFLDHFNEFDDGCECDIQVAAYLGHWLWQRFRSDVVREHGGTVDEFMVGFGWSPGMADVVLEVAPYADPEWEIPPDHPLALTDGQEALFGEVA